MKRKIFLVRHGESADKQIGQRDFERSLTQKGKISIELLGNFFKEEHLLPKCVVASPAVRSRETSTLLLNVIGFSLNEIEYDEQLYSGTDEHYMQVVRQSTVSLMIIGHNPSISYVIGKITGDYSIALHPGQCAIIEMNDDESAAIRQSIKLIGPFHR